MDKDITWKLKWDYSARVDLGYTISRSDWNQTLVTKINRIATQIHQSSLLGPGDTVIIHPTISHIFKNMEYYDDETKMLSKKYDIILDDTIPKNMVFIECKLILNNSESTDEAKRKARGCIEIKNFIG